MSLVKLALVFLAAHLATAFYFVFDRAPGTAAALAGLPLDDAWIHLVYARSLAALHGFAFNPGQLETGSTSPLWAMLLVPASWASRLFGIGVVIPAKLTGVLVATGASLAAARLLRCLKFGLAAEVAAGLAIAADPALGFAQVSGMEVMLAGALALWALGDLAAERHLAASFSAALAPLARPELALLTVLVLAVAEWRIYRERASMRARLLVMAPTLMLVGGWMLYCLLVSGYPLPSTFYAKFTSRQEFFARNLETIFTQVLPSWPWFSRGTGMALWGGGNCRALSSGSGGGLDRGAPGAASPCGGGLAAHHRALAFLLAALPLARARASSRHGGGGRRNRRPVGVAGAAARMGASVRHRRGGLGAGIAL